MFLLEIFVGRRGRLSRSVESKGLVAIRLGLHWGHDLSTRESRRRLRRLLLLCRPLHVWVAWPCGAWSGWSRLNLHKEPSTAQRVLDGRKLGKRFLDMFFEIAALANEMEPPLNAYAENPYSSAAFEDPRFETLGLDWIHIDVCAFHLGHPETGTLHKKPAWILSSNYVLREYIDRRCAGDHCHQPLEGAYQGRSLTAWAEDYAQEFAAAVVKGLVASNELSREYYSFPPVSETIPPGGIPAGLDTTIIGILNSLESGVFCRADFGRRRSSSLRPGPLWR